MSVKVITANSTLTPADFGATVSLNTNRVRSLYHNTIPWADATDYNFNLEFLPGHFNITVTRGTTVLAAISINDSTYTSGRFGFYNYSQAQVRYAGFTRRPPSAPAISVLNRSVVEGNAGTTNLVFSVSLSHSNCEPTLVDYAITPGSATPGQDYTGVFRHPGVCPRKPIGWWQSMVNEILRRPDETPFLTLSNLISGTRGATGVGTIINDDADAVGAADR
jgi:hypothetical protein